jgi:hypothetical protein
MKNRTLKILALMFFVLAGVMAFIGSSGHAQKTKSVEALLLHSNLTATPASSALDLLSPRSLAQQQGEKTVEQARKNIQVLKGMPDSQLSAAMDFISSSLGVNCAYCHVVPQMEKDDKPEKAIARKMILMQFAINKENKDIFGETGAVTCFTCHRGQTKPQVMPVLPVALPATAQAKAAEALPTTDQILNKYVQAMGGKAAIEKLKTRVMTGSQVTSDGTAIPLETYQAAPDKVVSILTPKNGVFMSGYNGHVGWVKNARGQRELSGAQLAEMKRSADFYGDLKFKEIFPGLEIVDREKVGDRDAYVLASQVTPTRINKLYFDTQTGLLLRILSITQTMLAPIPDQTDFEDYREVDGVKLPFIIRRSAVNPRDSWTRKYTEIKQNIPVDDAKFNPPPAASPAPTPK